MEASRMFHLTAIWRVIALACIPVWVLLPLFNCPAVKQPGSEWRDASRFYNGSSLRDHDVAASLDYIEYLIMLLAVVMLD